MKQIKDYRNYISINGKEWQDTSIWSNLRYCEPKEEKIFKLDTFEEAVAAINKGLILKAEIGRTLFGNKPIIKLRTHCDEIKITAKNFKSIRVKHTYEEPECKTTINILSDHLPADEFCEYLKDRGIFQISVK